MKNRQIQKYRDFIVQWSSRDPFSKQIKVSKQIDTCLFKQVGLKDITLLNWKQNLEKTTYMLICGNIKSLSWNIKTIITFRNSFAFCYNKYLSIPLLLANKSLAFEWNCIIYIIYTKVDESVCKDLVNGSVLVLVSSRWNPVKPTNPK